MVLNPTYPRDLPSHFLSVAGIHVFEGRPLVFRLLVVSTCRESRDLVSGAVGELHLPPWPSPITQIGEMRRPEGRRQARSMGVSGSMRARSRWQSPRVGTHRIAPRSSTPLSL